MEEQQELNNFKYFQKKTGRWIFVLLIVVALGYLGYTICQGQKASKDQGTAVVLTQMVEKTQQKTDQKVINADLVELQKNHPDSISTTRATLMAAAIEFDADRYDVAEGHLNWVLKNQKAPLVQALTAQRLGVILLQQKKYDTTTNALNTQVETDFEPLMLETKGGVYVAQNKIKEAVQSYEAVLSKLPQTAVDRELLRMKIDSLG